MDRPRTVAWIGAPTLALATACLVIGAWPFLAYLFASIVGFPPDGREWIGNTPLGLFLVSCVGAGTSFVLIRKGRKPLERVLALVALTLAAASLLICAVPLTAYVQGSPNSADWTGDHVLWWLPAGFFGLWAGRRFFKRKRNGPAMALGFITFAGGSLLGLLSKKVLSAWELAGGDEPHRNLLRILNEYTGKDLPSSLLTIVALMGICKVARTVLFEDRFRAWFGTKPESDSGYPAKWRFWPAFGMAMLVWLLFGYVPFLIEYAWGFLFDGSWYISDYIPEPLMAALPFVAAAGVLLWKRTERLAVDEDGISLFLFRPRFALFRVPWKRVRHIDVVRHGAGQPTFVVHYRSRLRLPFSLGIHPNRYVGGDALVALISTQIGARWIPVRQWGSSKWAVGIGVVAMVAGAVFMRLQIGLSNWYALSYANGEIPAYDIERYAALPQLTILFLSAVSCIGLGLGMHSAYHRGGARPALLALWLIGSQFVPDPVLHWLVAIAMHAIITAQMGLPVYLHAPSPHLATIPSEAQWDTYMMLVKMSPAFSGAAYVLGVVLGRWPWRLIRMPRAESAEVSAREVPEAAGAPQLVAG